MLQIYDVQIENPFILETVNSYIRLIAKHIILVTNVMVRKTDRIQLFFIFELKGSG